MSKLGKVIVLRLKEGEDGAKLLERLAERSCAANWGMLWLDDMRLIDLEAMQQEEDPTALPGEDSPQGFNAALRMMGGVV